MNKHKPHLQIFGPKMRGSKNEGLEEYIFCFILFLPYLIFLPRTVVMLVCSEGFILEVDVDYFTYKSRTLLVAINRSLIINKKKCICYAALHTITFVKLMINLRYGEALTEVYLGNGKVNSNDSNGFSIRESI